MTEILSAQAGKELGKITISSPTAASLGKYADIPVNKNTGIPEISVPLYTVTSGPLSLPLTLSYHASGLKVQEVSGWTGAGFAMQAGGAITRTVRGLPDDRSSVVNQTKAHYVDYGYSNYLYRSGSDSLVADVDFANGVLDGEPDLYFFNFNGYAGKFYFNDDRTPVLVPEQDLKIEVGMQESIGTIEGFTITTPDGTKYYFGKNGNTGTVIPIEKTSVYSAKGGIVSGKPVSSWFLNKVSSADGLFSINLSYQPERYSYYTFSTEQVAGTVIPPDFPSGVRDAYLVKNSVEGVRLSQISFPNGTVDFIPSSIPREDLAGYDANDIREYANTEAKALQEVRIANANGFCKKYVFHYNYFTSLTSSPPVVQRENITVTSDTKHLRLDSLQEQSCDLSVKSGMYKFEYFNEGVPRSLSFGQDYWGFNNGYANSTIIPAITENAQTIPGADRKPRWPEMRAGTLKTITYPTGGTSIFEFEPHTTYASYINYRIAWQGISLGGDGNIFRSVPDSLIFVSNGDGVFVEMNNQSTVNDGHVNIYDANGVLSGAGMECPKGQSRSGYFNLAAGTYIVKLDFLQAGGNPAGQPLTVSVGKPYAEPINENAMVGGLRIKTITSSASPTATPMVTSFTYNKSDGKSSGELYNRPTFAMVKRNDLLKLVKDDTPLQADYSPPFCNENGCSACSFSSSQPYVKSGGDLRPMASAQGQHMGYTEVKVSQEENGYSIYNYYWSKFLQYPYLQGPPGAIANVRVVTNSCDANLPNYPTTPLPFEYQKGLPQFEGHFDQSGNPIKSIQYNYLFQENPFTTPGYIVVNDQYLWGSFYTLNTGRKLEEQAIEVTYSAAANDTIYRGSIYGSPYHNQPTKTSMLSSKGDSIISKLRYSFDYRVPACEAIGSGVSTYLEKEVQAKNDLDQAILRADQFNQGNRWIAVQRYKRALANARAEFISYRRTNFSNATNNFNTAHNAAKASAGTTWKPILQMQDNFQNQPVEVTDWKGGKLVGAAYTSYLISGTTTVYPNSSDLLGLVVPSPTFDSSKVSGSDISRDLRYRFDNSITFGDGNIVETKVKKFAPTAYLWGYNGQYPVAKIVGSSYANASAVVTQAQINAAVTNDATLRTLLQTLRTDSRTKAALTSSFTYNPLVGITSETDPSGKVIFSEYDNLGRMITQKDERGNITTKICYNYVGQIVNCNTGEVIDPAPNWNPTGNVRCAKDGADNNTGNQEREERDINANSPTYNQFRWVDIGQNLSSCPLPVPSVNVTLKKTSSGAADGNLLNKSTGQSFSISAISSAAAGSPNGYIISGVPKGSYTLSISPILSSVPPGKSFIFNINGDIRQSNSPFSVDVSIQNNFTITMSISP
ncbi:hypothetical protein LQ567_00515 [Niabella pedocola]|uniref:PA14 domain-containing protein n=1 Tax=Niabella pedocola TaxID=1752077 RepID=A0ABS8PJI6_9BACT|nr:hypothetical protein [Niabella pedocola]MCD2421224.1 hypothetical protein [Niabella pedocola]